MTIADLLHVLRKHIVTAATAFVVIFVAVAAFTFLSPPKYTATAELFATYSGQSDGSQNSNEMNSGASYLSTQIKTYPQLIKTQAILQPVIDDLSLNMTVKDLADMVTATNPTNTFMVDIAVEAGDAQQRLRSPIVCPKTWPSRFPRPYTAMMPPSRRFSSPSSKRHRRPLNPARPRFLCIWLRA